MNQKPETLNIQAVFFDIDGTLVSFKTHTIPPDTKAAINQLRAQGIKVIISTGRSKSDIINLEDLIFDGFITANGAYCVDSQGEVIASHPISRESIANLAHYIAEKPFPCSFITEHGNYINYIDDLIMTLSRMVEVPLPPVKPVAEILADTVYQLDAFINVEREAEILSSVMMDCAGCRWHPIFTDINSKECNKATGIDRFLAHFGLSNDCTMAFGDGGNDISMLRHATIGVAMGNAKDPVKAAADYVTTSVDDHGVVDALKHFGLIAPKKNIFSHTCNII